MKMSPQGVREMDYFSKVLSQFFGMMGARPYLVNYKDNYFLGIVAKDEPI